MKQKLVFLLLMGLMALPAAQADDFYSSVSYGYMRAADSDTNDRFNNFGFIIGATQDDGGFGFELMGSFTVNAETVKINTDNDGKEKMSAIGFYAIYQSPGRVYVKGKAGLAYVNYKVDLDDDAPDLVQDDISTGFSYGITGGVQVGKNGAIELSYLVLPELNDVYVSSDDTIDVELISLGYNWNF